MFFQTLRNEVHALLMRMVVVAMAMVVMWKGSERVVAK
jgi:hypothetical protein